MIWRIYVLLYKWHYFQAVDDIARQVHELELKGTAMTAAGVELKSRPLPVPSPPPDLKPWVDPCPLWSTRDAREFWLPA